MYTTFEKLLLKAGLIQQLSFNFKLSQQEFHDLLQDHVDPKDGFNFFEVFSSSPYIYKGSVQEGSFELRRKRKVFDFNMGLARISGKTHELDKSLKTEITVSFPIGIPIAILAFFALIYGLTTVLILSGTFGELGPEWLLYILLHGVFMLLLFYWILWEEIRRGKKAIERDLPFFMNEDV